MHKVLAFCIYLGSQSTKEGLNTSKDCMCIFLGCFSCFIHSLSVVVIHTSSILDRLFNCTPVSMGNDPLMFAKVMGEK